MAATKRKVSIDVKNQILERIKIEGITVPDIAKEHGLHPATIYGWMAKGVTALPSMLELSKLKKENQMLLELIGKLTVDVSVEKKKMADF